MKTKFNRIVLGALLGMEWVGCNPPKPAQEASTPNPPKPVQETSTPRDPNVIETKLADGRVLHYTKQQLDEVKSWGHTKDEYDSALAQGHTHGELIETMKHYYWVKSHGALPTPAGGITPPPEMRKD
jgi:hypothetical protein